MKKLLSLLTTAAVLGVLASSASAKPVHWNVKCEKIVKLHLRKGIDCAHTVKAGKTWKFPKDVWWQKDFTTTGTALSATFQIAAVGGRGSLFGVGPAGKYGQLWSGEAPYSIRATRKMIVVAATKKSRCRRR